ncbi:ATP-binding cassette domain-containing protein [Crocosphaera sp. XPORK-15E]|uniref:ATP-binding cassette domain-containing protein n=1 Tax=Crocosphaera sp. XPORK-15E TaxID=3110247 RepID=UPI002B2156C1|nr:ATP-binding cassette domain-containing protein [Crocosphaera sp. XPORK-15E]MEA5533685.1 ATP-binding cassette domain-containing protein [Crocosphaera sp. XPORK-15E]
MNTPLGSRTVLIHNPTITISNQGQIWGPFDLIRPLHRLGRDSNQVDLIVPDHDPWRVIGSCQASFCQEGDDYRIFDGNQVKASTNRLFFNNTLITPQTGLLLQDGMEITIGQNPVNYIVITYSNPNASQGSKPPQKNVISLKNKSVELGRDPMANLQLDASTVSRRHAIIDGNAQGQYILTDCSTNGVFVNEQKVTGKALLPPGARIRIGPYTLILQGDNLIVADRGDNIRLDAKNLQRIVKDKQGQDIPLLQDISFPVEPGQFVALVGGSGAGKSTLLRTLLGIEPIQNGVVELNGEDLRKNFNIYRTLIGYVPQYDIVHQNLTVKEVLYYGAKLRLPADVDINQEVEKTLKQIELVERENTLVKALSGGQLKRVSIGVELLADPKLFFLDEPTSGLDPGLDKKIMTLLRNLSNEGRTIILVTHTTLNIQLCDRLAFLGKGGYLCYFGPPQETNQFFNLKSQDFSDIYIHLEEQNIVEQESERFKKNDQNFYQTYITNHLPQVQQPIINNSPPQKVKRSLWQQLSILSQRYVKLLSRDPLNLSLSLLTAPLGIIFMRLALSEKIPFISSENNDPTFATLSLKVLFVFTCAAIWVGLGSSLQEIIKEAQIYQRERLVNLGILAYLGSKAIVLGGLSFLQSLLITVVILIFFKSPENQVFNWFLGIEITIFLTLFSTLSLGIMISSLVKNITQSNSSLPLLLLPQIIFSGVLFKMTGIGKFFSWLMISRWSVGALGSLVNIELMIPETSVSPLNPNPVSIPIDIPLEVYEATFNNLFKNWGFLLLHSLIYWVITYIIQKRKDIL